MKYRRYCAVILSLCLAQAARADLTMRHTIEIKFGSFLPPAAVEAMKLQLGDQMPKQALVQVKGKKVFASISRMIMIADYAKGVITLMDPKTRRFATSPVATYAERIAAAQKQMIPAMTPQVREIFDKIQFDVKSDRTGKAATIQGMRTEEILLTVSIELPATAGPAMQMKMEVHQWRASAEEVNRVPALKELEAYVALPKSGMDPMELMTKSMATFPGMAEKLRGPIQEMTKDQSRAMLRLQSAMFMPAMAQLVGGAADQPFAEYSMELAELSSAPLPDSLFEVPAEYQSAPMEELIQTLFPAPKPQLPSAGPKVQLPAGEQPKILPQPLPPGVYRVGNGVSAPSLISKTEPTYTEEARAAKISGSVLLGLVVGADGIPQQIKVLRSLDPGLDQKAVEALATWKFKPGMKDGAPVMVQAQIEVNFRLM